MEQRLGFTNNLMRESQDVKLSLFYSLLVQHTDPMTYFLTLTKLTEYNYLDNLIQELYVINS